ncbi:MAG: hypothetical protein QM733_08840 [Ilumatobacteraceae bacterium]
MTTDLADNRIDQLARRAAADLRATAARRAATLGAPRRRRRLLPVAIALGATMALLAALFVVTRDHHHIQPADPTRNLQWIIGDPPPGLALEITPPGPVTNSSSATLSKADLYATDAAPDGPVFRVYPPDAYALFMFSEATGITERSAGDRRAAIGTFGGLRIISVTLDSGSWTVASRGMSDDELVAAATGLQPVDDTTSAFADRSLPAGMHLVGRSPFADAMPMLSSGLGGTAPTAMSLQYIGGDDGPLILAVGEATPLNLALLGSAYYSLTPATIAGHPGWLGSAENTQAAAWVAHGQLFVMFGAGSGIDLAALAETVRQPSVDEWHRLVHAHGASPATRTDSTVVTDNPSATVPGGPTETSVVASPSTITGSTHDMPVTLDVRAITPNDVVVSTEVTGTTSTVDVAVAASVVVYRGPEGGGGQMFDLASTPEPGVNAWSDSDGGDGAMALTTGRSATALRVTTTTGERYVVGLVSVPARPDVRFAALVVPRRTLSSADLVDASGNVMSEIGPLLG